MEWAGAPSAGPPNSRQNKLKIIFDLPNNADIVLSPAQNLQVITIHNYLYCVDVLCTWVTLFADFVLQIAQNSFGGRAPPTPAGGAIALPKTA